MSDIIENGKSQQTDGRLKTQLVDGNGNVSHSTQDINGNWHTGVHVIQHNLVSANNSSTSNLNAGATFTGTSESTNSASVILVMFKCDVNCTVYIEQSVDGTNWDVSDPFHYTNYIDNFSCNAQVVGSYFRVKVTNVSSSNSTVFRLQSMICPISNPMPRTLDDMGHLPVAVHVIRDGYGFEAENTPNGEIRAIAPVLLVGAAFEGSILDPNFWLSTVANGGTNTVANNQVTIATNTTANGSAKLNSVRRARYTPGQSNRYRSYVQLNNTGVSNNVRKWGVAWGSTMPTITDGYYFQLNGTTFSVVTLKGGVETKIDNGSFTGDLGSSVIVNTNCQVYEIYWNNHTVYFSLNGNILHTISGDSATLSNTVQFHVYAESTNSSGITSNNTMSLRNHGIATLGNRLSQPTSFYQSGTTAGAVCKYGVGCIHSMIISNVTNNANVTLYDNTSATGSPIWSSGAMSNQTVPFWLNFNGKPFYTGLTLVISGANCNVDLHYE